MSDKLDILIGMVERLEDRMNEKFDEFSKNVMDFNLAKREMQMRHDNCPGDLALARLAAYQEENKKFLSTANFLYSKPRLVMASIIGFLVIATISIVITVGTTNFVSPIVLPHKQENTTPNPPEK